MRIETLAEELAKPEDVRLREVLDALDGRAVIFDGLGARVGHLLDEMDEWIGRAGEAERMVESARRSLASVADHMTDHAYQELASALESPPASPSWSPWKSMSTAGSGDLRPLTRRLPHRSGRSGSAEFAAVWWQVAQRFVRCAEAGS